MTDPIMTIREVAQALRVAEKTAYAMANDGEIPAFKVRGQWRVRRVDFESWLASQAGMAESDKSPSVRPVPLSAASPAAENSAGATRLLPMDDLTERLPQEELHHQLLRALGPGAVRLHAPVESKPFEMDLAPPLPYRVRVYMYNATRPPGGRPLGEHKIQLIVPGKGRGERASFDNGDGRIVLLIGYAAEEDVFILWDAGLYPDFAWSRNVQVKAETIIEASAGKLATQERQLRPATGKATVETVLAAKSRRLAEAIVRRMELTRERMLRD
jgi:excisionase family DNA binding protein